MYNVCVHVVRLVDCIALSPQYFTFAAVPGLVVVGGVVVVVAVGGGVGLLYSLCGGQ